MESATSLMMEKIEIVKSKQITTCDCKILNVSFSIFVFLIVPLEYKPKLTF